jgi:hypothetical protein
MAMNGTALGNKIADDILITGGGGDGLTGGEATLVRNYWITIASDITNHIDVNAQILPASFTAGVTAVTGEGDIT